MPCKSVVTIHDCIHLMFPQYLPNRLAYGYARTFLWWAAHGRADHDGVGEHRSATSCATSRFPEQKITSSTTASTIASA